LSQFDAAGGGCGALITLGDNCEDTVKITESAIDGRISEQRNRFLRYVQLDDIHSEKNKKLRFSAIALGDSPY
jgi:hypothetical protein